MGALTRVIGGLLLVAGVLGAREAAAQQTLPLKPIMLGAARMPDVKNAEGRVPRPAIWHREMARQGFLIAAREEFGLPTRDLILGEAVDLQDPLCFHPVVTSHYVTGTVITITQSGKEIYKNTAKTTGNRTRHYMGELVWEEEQSRTGYAEALARLGYQRRANPDFNQRLVPPDAAELLSRMNEISQFAAVRRIHHEIAEKGESPELLSGLARGYAHLTQLMMPVPDNMYGVFGARAMLYAQRLLTRLPNDPHSHLTRAYVMAWVGLPNQTEADLKKASELGAAPASWPQWAKLADLYWRARFLDLSRIVRDENATERQAAAILMFRIIRTAHSEMLVQESGNLALSVCPDNMFILWHMCDRGGVISSHEVTQQIFVSQAQRIASHLSEVKGLPEVLEADRRRVNQDPHSVNRFARGMLSATLDDRGEPSQAALGNFLLNWNFECLYMRQQFLLRSLGVDIKELISETQGIMDGSQGVQAIYIAQGFPSNATPADFDALAQGRSTLELNIHSHAYSSLRFLPKEFHVGTTTKEALADDSWAFVGMFEDGMYRRFSLYGDENKLANLYFIPYHANHSALYAELRLTLQWDTVTPEEIEYWEQQIDQLPNLEWALARHYKNRREFEQSFEHYRRYLSVIPDADIWIALADAYYLSGDDEKWKAALESAFKCPDYKLTHSLAGDWAAGTLMHAGKYSEALPWAERAAASGSHWGMEVLADCLTALGRTREAEELVQAISLRYDQPTWYQWCIEAGSGDVDNALQHAQRVMEPYAQNSFIVHAPDLESLLLVARGDLDGARAHLEQSNLAPLWLSLLADQQGEAAGRDQIWKKLAEIPADDEQLGGFGIMARAFQKHLGNPDGVLDTILREMQGKSTKYVNENMAKLFVSIYLDNRGRTDAALPLCQEVARTGNRTPYRCLAWLRLRKAGVDPIQLEGRNFNRRFKRAEEVDADAAP